MISNVLRYVIIGLLTFLLVKAQEIQGTPGVDYPNFVTIPNSSFKCSDQEFIPGFYADLETQCQAYHYCSEESQETFLCPIGSIFNQEKLACDAWYNFNCTLASQFYSSNSGFLLESAMKSVPLLIKLRNRAKNRLSFRVPANNVHEKITSLYDGSELNLSSTEGSSFSNDVNAEQDPVSNESQGEKLNEDESLDDILSRLQDNIPSDEPADGIYNTDGNGGASDNMQGNSFFYPVTEQYYVDPESPQNEWSRKFEDDRYGFYDRENFAYKYSLAMQDSEESRDLVESSEPIDLYRGDEMNNEEVADQFLKRQRAIEPFRRLRRKPIYTVTQDDMHSEDVTTESVSVPSVETTTMIDRSYTLAPFEMVEDLSRMHMTPLNITEVPMTSEEFEEAIIRELVVPKIDELDLPLIGSSWDHIPDEDLPLIGSSWGHDQPNEGNLDGTSSDVQNDGYYRYVENERPEQFVYSNVESSDENFDADSGTIDTAEYYQDGERSDGDSEKSDDTFVVIPDASEIPEFSEAFDMYESPAEPVFKDLGNQNVNEDAAARDSTGFNIPTNYGSQDVYSVGDPSQYRIPTYSTSDYTPGQYFQQEYFNPVNESPYDYESSYVADDPRALRSQQHQYGFEASDPRNQYVYASPESYACQQQIGYTNCMYGPQSEYPYAGYYHNPYVNNFRYGVSDTEESSESPVSGVQSSSSESQMSYMITSDSNMNNEQFEINPDYEDLNSYYDRNREASDYSEEFSPDSSDTIVENIDQKETYYLLEDDETTSEVNPESASELPSLDNMDGVNEVTGNQGETYFILEDEEKIMEGGSEAETFVDSSESEKVNEQQAFSQEKPSHLEEQSTEDSSDGMLSQTTDSKGVSQSEGNAALGDSAKPGFGSTMDSRFTHVTEGGPFAVKNDRNGDVLQDSSEQLSINDETSKVSSHSNLPNMFLNNMAFSDPISFGPHGFGSSMGQPMAGGSPTPFSFTNGRKPTSDSASSDVSKLSALQDRIRSLKQGKFGAFKKYVSSSGSKK